MNTYKSEIVSPFQVKNLPYDIQNNRAVQDEIRKNLKTISLTAEFVQDTETLQAFKHINGVVAFLCILKKNGLPIGFGRGLSVISSQNRFLEKTVSFAANAALIDSVVRAVKVLSVTDLEFSRENTIQTSNEVYVSKPVETFVPISDKQRSYLLKLLESSGASEEELNQVDEMSKTEARERINQIVSNGVGKMNY